MNNLPRYLTVLLLLITTLFNLALWALLRELQSEFFFVNSKFGEYGTWLAVPLFVVSVTLSIVAIRSKAHTDSWLNSAILWGYLCTMVLLMSYVLELLLQIPGK